MEIFNEFFVWAKSWGIKGWLVAAAIAVTLLFTLSYLGVLDRLLDHYLPAVEVSDVHA